MIVKVPIYLEVDKIEPDALSHLVETANKKFTTILRREKIETFEFTKLATGAKYLSKIKIITREKALDFLRTSK